MNRRSVSATDSRPPQRLKSNGENNAGTQLASESSVRASRPKARSMLLQIPSGGKRSSSQSGIPVPGAGAKGKAPTASKRSASIGVPMLKKNTNRQLTTPSASHGPRASSGTGSRRQSCITPQRYLGSQSTRKSLLYSTGKMTSTGSKIGLGTQRLSGRGSAIGAATCKDTRPLTDKSYQQSQVKKILDFLRKHNYENNSLTSKHFPLSSKEYVGIFNFIYEFIQSGTPAVPYQRFEEHVIPILKSLKYPGQLSKANFLSLSSMHSWPNALGGLSYMCDLVIVYTEKIFPNITAIGFLDKNDQGFLIDKESDDKIIFTFYTDIFQEFNTGADEFCLQYEKLEDTLMESNGVDVEHLKILQKKEIELKTQLTQLENTPSNLETLREQWQNLEGDREKLFTYSKSMELHINKITNDKELQLKIEYNLTIKLINLEGDIKKLREIQLSGEVSSLDDENSTRATECRRQVEQAKKDRGEIDKEIFKQEIKVSKAREGLESIVKQFNSLSVEEGIGGEDPLVLSVPVFRGGELVEEEDNEGHRSQLVELLKDKRAATRNTERELQADVVKVEQLEDVCRQRKTEEAQKKKDVKSRQEELATFRESMEKEDSSLDAQISYLNETLFTIHSQEGIDIQTKTRQLKHLEEKLAQAKLLQQSKQQEGLDFLNKSCADTRSYIKENENLRDAAAKSVKEQADAVVNALRESMADIRIKVDAILEELEKDLE